MENSWYFINIYIIMLNNPPKGLNGNALGGLPTAAYTRRLRLIGVLFSGFRYLKGYGGNKLSCVKG